jgi:r-opsin
LNHKSYILASCFFQYGGNIIFIVGCYFFIVKTVFHHEEELRQQAKKMNVTSLRNNAEQDAVTAEMRIAKIAIINITLWIFAWTPFTVICILGTWGSPTYITALVSEIPIVCAKTSAVYNPIIYALSHPKYRECLKEICPWLCIVVEKKKCPNHSSDSDSAKTSATDSALVT